MLRAELFIFHQVRVYEDIVLVSSLFNLLSYFLSVRPGSALINIFTTR